VRGLSRTDGRCTGTRASHGIAIQKGSSVLCAVDCERREWRRAVPKVVPLVTGMRRRYALRRVGPASTQRFPGSVHSRYRGMARPDRRHDRWQVRCDIPHQAKDGRKISEQGSPAQHPKSGRGGQRTAEKGGDPFCRDYAPLWMLGPRLRGISPGRSQPTAAGCRRIRPYLEAAKCCAQRVKREAERAVRVR